MTYKVGEMLKISYANAYFIGLIVELFYDDHLDDTLVRIWRPEVGFQTWPLNGHYKIESMNTL